MGVFSDLFASDQEVAAKRYGALQEQQLRKEGADEDKAWEKTFEDLKSRGYSASDALMPAVNDAGDYVPGTGMGSGYEAPDPLTRWKTQIDGMITSGDPILQKKGMDMLGAYQTRATQPLSKTAAGTTAMQEYQYAVQQDGFKGTFQDWKEAMKSGTTTNVNMGGDGPERVKESDLKNYIFPPGVVPPVGATYDQIRDLGAVYKPPVGADAAGRQAMMETASSVFPILDAFILQDDGGVNERILDGAFYHGLDPTPGKALATKGLGMMGLSPQEIEQVKQVSQAFEMGFQAITRTETGAAMPQEEIQNTKERFQPGPNDGPAAKRQKYLAYKYFIENALNLMDPTVQKTGNATQLTQEVNRIATEALDKFEGDKASGKTEEGLPSPASTIYHGVDLSTVDFGD